MSETLTTLTPAQRQAAYRARLRAQGLKELRQLWAHPKDELAIRKYAAECGERRQKSGAVE